MDKSSFSKNSPGKLIRVKRGEWAFYPDPLPPSFEPGWEVVEQVSAASRALGELAGLIRTAPGAEMFNTLFEIREAIDFTESAGGGVSVADVLVYAHGAAASGDGVRRAFTVFSAIQRGRRSLADLPLSLSLAQDMSEWLSLTKQTGSRGAHPGSFRTASSGARAAQEDGPLLREYTPPPEAQMKVALFAFDKFLRHPPRLPAVVRAALILFQFNAIRPFSADNHLIGGLLPGLALFSWRAAPFAVSGLGRWLKERQDEFTRLFFGVVRDGQWAKWIEFCSSAIADRAGAMAAAVADLLALRERYIDRLREGRSSTLLPQLLDELFVTPAITTKSAAKQLRVTFRAAQLNIDKLVEAGILLEATGRKRNRVYIAPELISTVDGR